MPKDLFASQPKDLLASQTPRQPFVGGVIDSLGQGVTMGWGDELTALESAALGRTPQGGWFDYSQPFKERYSRNLAGDFVTKTQGPPLRRKSQAALPTP